MLLTTSQLLLCLMWAVKIGLGGHKRYYQTCFSFGVYLFDRTFALLVPFALVMVG